MCEYTAEPPIDRPDVDEVSEASEAATTRIIRSRSAAAPIPVGANVPERIGPYRLLSTIGRGGMGVVYLAWHTVLEVHHAVKMLLPSLAADPLLRVQFIREAQQAARLSHPNVVWVFDADVTDNIYYIAMEWIRGHSLYRLGCGGEQLPIDQTVAFCHQIAKALHVTHRSGLVHCDIKPSNILIEEDTNTAKLTDFGLVHQLVAPTTGNEAGPDAILGSPPYMSPEQWLNQPVDGRSDLFSLGVVLYQLVSGRLPSTEDQPIAIFEDLRTRSVPPLREVAPHADPYLEAIVAWMLEFDREARTPDAITAARELEGWWATFGPGDRPADLLPILLDKSTTGSGRLPSDAPPPA